METMRKINNVEEALALFQDAAIKHEEASKEGNYKVVNLNYGKIADAVKFLKERCELDKLSVFYNHPSAGVCVFAAAYLLPVFEDDSIRVLRKISKGKGLNSVTAEMTLKEWLNGNLRDFYTK